jgi:hypothetical protein
MQGNSRPKCMKKKGKERERQRNQAKPLSVFTGPAVAAHQRSCHTGHQVAETGAQPFDNVRLRCRFSVANPSLSRSRAHKIGD